MTELERIVLQRAEEQVSNLSLRRGWERDSWDVAKDHAPESRRRSSCLAGDCARPVRVGPYCAMHAERVRKTGVVDGPFGLDRHTIARKRADQRRSA